MWALSNWNQGLGVVLGLAARTNWNQGHGRTPYEEERLPLFSRLEKTSF